jgi:hypothetical protein
MDIPNQEKQYGESFSDFFTRTSFRTNQKGQKANSLATLLLSPASARLCPAKLITNTFVYSSNCFLFNVAEGGCEDQEEAQ